MGGLTWLERFIHVSTVAVVAGSCLTFLHELGGAFVIFGGFCCGMAGEACQVMGWFSS